MTQAYPQFTPVQILEAGQRAIADGRHEYATQFFQHLVDHHATTPEAARARDVLARLNAQSAPQYVNGNPAPPQLSPAAAGRPAAPRHPPASQADARRVAPTQPRAAVQNPGTSQPTQAQPPSSYPEQATVRTARLEPAFGTPPPAQELPGHLARQERAAPPARQQSAAPNAHSSAHRAYLPAPEKHYIVGRVIAGLVLLIGIVGVFAGIGLIFAAFSDPSIFNIVGATGSIAALTFAVSVFVGSMALLIVSQIATAIFNGADAVGDLARLERFRAGDYDDEED